LNSRFWVVFLEFLSIFALLEVFKNFWMKNGEVSRRNEELGIFDENVVFTKPKNRPSSH